MQFATNYLGHFALTLGLHGALVAATGARIVTVSSSGNLIAPVIFDDPHFDFMPYDPLVAYGQSKTACALLAIEAARRWQGQGIFANALNPGAIATNLQRHTGGLKTAPEGRKTVAQGAATSVLLAANPMLEGIGGRYFEDCTRRASCTADPMTIGALLAMPLTRMAPLGSGSCPSVYSQTRDDCAPELIGLQADSACDPENLKAPPAGVDNYIARDRSSHSTTWKARFCTRSLTGRLHAWPSSYLAPASAGVGAELLCILRELPQSRAQGRPSLQEDDTRSIP